MRLHIGKYAESAECVCVGTFEEKGDCRFRSVESKRG